MNNLSNYIIEKLHFNKDTNVDTYSFTLEKIFRLCGLQVDNDGNDEEIQNTIYKWIKDNNVKDVYSLAYRKDLDNYGTPKDIIKEFDRIDDNNAMDAFYKNLIVNGKNLFYNINSHIKIMGNEDALSFKDISYMKNPFIFVKKG